ncbi:MAG: hypothetical protein OXC95_18560 [Dehalococcoidia bacterium]|nr:hypothetical protein [Dehalococcoidia bacterium]
MRKWDLSRYKIVMATPHEGRPQQHPHQGESFGPTVREPILAGAQKIVVQDTFLRISVYIEINSSRTQADIHPIEAPKHMRPTPGDLKELGELVRRAVDLIDSKNDDTLRIWDTFGRSLSKRLQKWTRLTRVRNDAIVEWTEDMAKSLRELELGLTVTTHDPQPHGNIADRRAHALVEANSPETLHETLLTIHSEIYQVNGR